MCLIVRSVWGSLKFLNSAAGSGKIKRNNGVNLLCFYSRQSRKHPLKSREGRKHHAERDREAEKDRESDGQH
jgi:hypothetical protein